MQAIQQTIGRYDVVDVIGRGGASTVYLAYQHHLDRRVALKELAPHYAADRTFADSFVRESRLTAAMSHPSIVTVHEYFEEGGVPVIAMEYLPRGSLRSLVGRLDVAGIATMLESVLAGLAHGERIGVVHGGIKPENLLVADDGQVKIADFGVAAAMNEATVGATAMTTAALSGPPRYMAPEQALGDELAPAADLYSLGVVTWELLTGRSRFARDRAGIDRRLEEWLGQMLCEYPEKRFQSAQPAWEKLEDIVIELLGPRWRRGARLAPQTLNVGPEAENSWAESEPHPARRQRSPSDVNDARPSQTPIGSLGPGVRARASLAAIVARSRHRAWRWPWTALTAALASATIATVLVVALLGGDTPRSRPSARLPAPDTNHASAPAALERNVDRLNQIVKLFVAGKRLSHKNHNFQAAAWNRQLVLARLGSFDAQPRLRPAVHTLLEMAIDSLSFNLDMVHGETLLARVPDDAHNALRPRFVAEFDPYARRYLGVTYSVEDL